MSRYSSELVVRNRWAGLHNCFTCLGYQFPLPESKIAVEVEYADPAVPSPKNSATCDNFARFTFLTDG